VTSDESVAQAAQHLATRTGGRLDLLINNVRPDSQPMFLVHIALPKPVQTLTFRQEHLPPHP
jgi:NAD(P)-dependent dehydrogenase (short-subunit alcohol dehydrogenase family)